MGKNRKMANSVKVILARFKKDKEKMFPIAFRITINRKPRYIFLGYKVKETDWTEKNGGQVKSHHAEHGIINARINTKRAEINHALLKAELEKPDSFSSSQIKKSVQRKNKVVGFFQVADEYFAELASSKKISRISGEKPRIEFFKKFVKETTASNEILFNDLNEALLKRFIAYLKANKTKEERTIKERTVMNYLIGIRTIYNRAVSEGYADKKNYPFGKGRIRIKFPESIKIGLTEDEVKQIENLKLIEGSPRWHARNVWLVSFYFAGIRIGDALGLRWSDLKNGRLYYTMNKNQKTVSVKIPEKATAIFENYKVQKRDDDDFIFPELKAAIENDAQSIYRKTHTASKKFGKHMNKIAEICKINKNITSHIARHTFGNISGEKISPLMLQKLYRHSDIRTTMGYQANFIYKETDEALDSVINF